ncbi:amidase [Pokkaliibacter plantistimulans]|uniref:Amidase n=1 Tax=Pokkaliibacter plantistimulans TaxID=1635171 RepID=A0ABX5M5E2_9GAMM|nr:amidase [Pokkaliibacter plantistimulans]
MTLPILLSILAGETYYYVTKTNLNSDISVGFIIDDFNGVKVYFNGGVNNSSGRNLTSDNYNLGIKYQCVEFIKRYYYQRFNHKMPDSMGNAKDYFNAKIDDGVINPQRGLLQYKNGSNSKPQVDDIIVFAPSLLNPYGHVAIVSSVFPNTIQIVQQNPGPFASSRAVFTIEKQNGGWVINGKHVLGWLRLPTPAQT